MSYAHVQRPRCIIRLPYVVLYMYTQLSQLPVFRRTILYDTIMRTICQLSRLLYYSRAKLAAHRYRRNCIETQSRNISWETTRLRFIRAAWEQAVIRGISKSTYDMRPLAGFVDLGGGAVIWNLWHITKPPSWRTRVVGQPSGLTWFENWDTITRVDTFIWPLKRWEFINHIPDMNSYIFTVVRIDWFMLPKIVSEYLPNDLLQLYLQQ